MKNVKASIELYFAKNNSYPEKFGDLIDEGFLGKDANQDPCSNPYIYTFDKSENYYNLISTGPDGTFGTVDDISSQ